MEISAPIFQAAWEILEQLEDFARKYAPDYLADVEFQQKKLRDPTHFRYSWIVRRQFSDCYVQKGLQLAIEMQKAAVEQSEN